MILRPYFSLGVTLPEIVAVKVDVAEEVKGAIDLLAHLHGLPRVSVLARLILALQIVYLDEVPTGEQANQFMRMASEWMTMYFMPIREGGDA